MLDQNIAKKLMAQPTTAPSLVTHLAPMKQSISDIATEAITLLAPETDLERCFFNQIDFLNGLNWGKPRFGHPEGKVLYHIREVLDNVEKLNIDDEMRRKLRIITFVHDTFKHVEDRNRPRDWSKHHAAISRRFLAKFTDEKAVLDVTGMHDDAYYAWRAIHLFDNPESGEKRLANLVNTLGDDMQLFYLFFKCDTQTGDKIQTPVKWFEGRIKNIEIVNF